MEVRAKKRLSLGVSALLAVFGIGALMQRQCAFPFPAKRVGRPPVFSRFWRPVEVQRWGYVVPDTVAGHVHAVSFSVWHKWPEHPSGRIEMRTNNLGLRRDSDTSLRPDPLAFRILVIGDSHTDGMVYNEESLTSLLERDLNARGDLVPCEVLNGGVCFYGPQNYVGFLERYMPLQPRMVAVVFYVGNDFVNAIATAAARGVMKLPEREAGYYAKLRATSRGAREQGLNQTYFFKNFPDFEPVVIEIVAGEICKMSEICANAGVEFAVLVLPTKMEVEWDDADKRQAQRALDLEAADLTINRRLMTLLARRLDEGGVRCFDLLPAFRAHRGELFWEKDYHLSTAGHALVAKHFPSELVDAVPKR